MYGKEKIMIIIKEYDVADAFVWQHQVVQLFYNFWCEISVSI